jgi:hypothetical protein
MAAAPANHRHPWVVAAPGRGARLRARRGNSKMASGAETAGGGRCARLVRLSCVAHAWLVRGLCGLVVVDGPGGGETTNTPQQLPPSAPHSARYTKTSRLYRQAQSFFHAFPCKYYQLLPLGRKIVGSGDSGSDSDLLKSWDLVLDFGVVW